MGCLCWHAERKLKKRCWSKIFKNFKHEKWWCCPGGARFWAISSHTKMSKKPKKKIMSSYAAIGSFVHWMIFNGRPAFNNNNQHAALLYIILPLYWKLFFTFSCYHNSLIISFTLSDSPKNHTFSPLFQCSRAAFVTWICAAKDNTFSLLLLKPPTSSIHPPLPAPSPHSYCGFIHPLVYMFYFLLCY